MGKRRILPGYLHLARPGGLLGVRVDTLLGVPAAGGEAADFSQEAGRQTADDASQALCPRRGWIGRVAFAIALILLGLSFILNKQLGLSPDIWGLVWAQRRAWGWESYGFLRQLAPFGLGVAFIGFYYLLQNLGDPLPFTLTGT